MNTKKFSKAMGELDDKYVDEAIRYQRTRKKSSWVKWGAIAACLCLVVCAIAIPILNQPEEPIPGDLIPMVFVNDTIYFQSRSQQSYAEIQDGFDYLGKIESEVAPSQKPSEELQANHGIVGAEVYQYGEHIVVLIDGKYWLYEYANE